MAEPEPIQVGAPVKDPRRRAMIMLGVAVGLFLMIRVLPGLLFGGDDGGDEVGQVTFPPATGGTTPPPVTGGDGPVPETVASFSDKNPFLPLVTISVDTGDVSVTPTPEAPAVDPIEPFPGFDPGSGVVTDPGGTPTDPGATPTDPGTGGGTATPPTTAPPRQPDRIAMLELYTTGDGAEAARIRVNDTVHEVPEGGDFAGRYRALSYDLRTRCAQLLFGDERFTLCEGDEALK